MSTYAGVPFRDPAGPIEALTLEQLRDLKRAWFADAKRAGLFAQLRQMAVHLGRMMDARYPKYEFAVGDLVVFYDSYGGYVTVTAAGKRIASDHQTEEFIVPGAWLDALESRFAEARQTSRSRAASQEGADRERLIALLAPGVPTS